MAIILPKSLREIGDEAFSGCAALDGDLIAPEGLETIGKAAFAGCYGIDRGIQDEPLSAPENGGDIN